MFRRAKLFHLHPTPMLTMNTMKRILTLAGLAALALTGSAQTNPPVAAAPLAPPPAQTNAVAPSTEVKPLSGVLLFREAGATNAPSTNSVPTGEIVPLIVIDDVPLLDAVKNLTRQASLNFQFDPRVNTMSNQPNITIRFENVTAEDALAAVLDNNGLTIQRDPMRNIARITLKEAKTEEPVFMRVFQPNYCNASNMVDLLKPMISPRSRVMADPRTGQLIAVATTLEHELISNLLTKLDSPVRQILIETRFVETAKNPTSLKGVDWSGTLAAQHVSFGNGNTLASTLTTTPGAAVTTAGSSTPGGRILPGITTQNSHDSTTTSETSLPANPASSPGLSLDTARGFFPATAFLNADGAKAVLSFLNTDNDTEILSTPRTIALDGTPATMSVVRNYPIFEQEQGAISGGQQQASTAKPKYDEKVGDTLLSEVGVKLKVTPRIVGGTNVFLDLNPELSAQEGVFRLTLNDKVNEAPYFVRRSLRTSASVPSGHTLVLGGLVQDELSKSYTKVPVLGDLPGLGALFKSSSKKRTKTNLLIFVTPTIVQDEHYRATQTDFFNNQFKDKPEMEDWEKKNFNRAKPDDWTKPKTTAAAAKTDETK